jgi:group II intron reverse transcriptase/maturase
MRKSQIIEMSSYLAKLTMESNNNPEVRSMRSTNSDKVNGAVDIMSKVLSRNNLNLAYDRVLKNKGAAGVDNMTVYEMFNYLKDNKQALVEELRTGKYKPKPVKRVEIPKPDGSKRQLGIPTVIDRMIQQAIFQVLSPMYEKQFSDNSFGFRPNRDAHGAIQRACEYYDEGYKYVVDIDLKKFFDTVNHDKLMGIIGRTVKDKVLLNLIRHFLMAGIVNGDKFEKNVVGTPQGGPLSPLLANIYLNELDKLLESRGHKFVRYADDCNIYVRSKRAGERVLKSVTKFLEKDLKLTVNQQKTKVGSPSKLQFLGFHLMRTKNGAKPRPTDKAKKKFKQEIKRITKRNRGRNFREILKELNRYTRGWINYYGIGKMKNFIAEINGWLRRRLRQYIWKSWKNIFTRMRNLMKLGASRNDAKKWANSRKGYWAIAGSGVLTYTIKNNQLEKAGYMNISDLYLGVHSNY